MAEAAGSNVRTVLSYFSIRQKGIVKKKKLDFIFQSGNLKVVMGKIGKDIEL